MIGRNALVIPCCCWRPSWTRTDSGERCTGRQTGCMWGIPKAFAEPVMATAPRQDCRKWFFSSPCNPGRYPLSSPILKPYLHTGGPRIMLTAEQMLSLPGFFRHGRNTRLPSTPRTDPYVRYYRSTAPALSCGEKSYLRELMAYPEARDIGIYYGREASPSHGGFLLAPRLRLLNHAFTTRSLNVFSAL